MCFHILCLQKACKSLAVAVSQLSGFLSILFVLSFCVAIAGASENQAASVCSRPPTLLDEVLTPINESCPAALHHEIFLSSAAAGVSLLPRVAELNETALEKALDLVHSNNGTYIAVLYYASWCPFSRELWPVYDVLSSVFPSIHHVAVEESSVRPSVLSQYGVHSFPVVFVHNRTSRVRYHGSRTLEDFVYFYQNYTGLRSVSGGQVVKHADCGFAKLVFNVGKGVKEVCPYPWAISPQNWLQEDAYLTLAFLFLILRLLYILLPIVASAWTLY
ncbi:hypothetical protein CY35_10G046900 [Sphagnum magellanicum]|nr:hypothetical protein CY35_10G046900 [Sphagnum magellanicum]KAH9549952.1 hypothetical protein CY35_10G046900 [Sphagnum magellanicum]KAH9549953.1 hypothetical protein CY35_10G046900 [Sphagnum magellanicum]KAH9549954.1 hypothetical protein CY35_10G046900 [Sphagnum magellanicum]